jgi:hypothetical protein
MECGLLESFCSKDLISTNPRTFNIAEKLRAICGFFQMTSQFRSPFFFITAGGAALLFEIERVANSLVHVS